MKAFWNEHQKNCPLKTTEGDCQAQITLPDRDCDMGFCVCDEYSCPMIYWLEQYQIMRWKKGDNI